MCATPISWSRFYNKGILSSVFQKMHFLAKRKYCKFPRKRLGLILNMKPSYIWICIIISNVCLIDKNLISFRFQVLLSGQFWDYFDAQIYFFSTNCTDVEKQKDITKTVASLSYFFKLEMILPFKNVISSVALHFH